MPEPAVLRDPAADPRIPRAPRDLPQQIPWGPTLLCALGAIAVGASPILVRLADVGPFASAFWRAALSLPLLWLWMRAERPAAPAAPAPTPARRRMLWFAWIAGLFFAGDLAFWHLAILGTTIANATFLVASLPILFVALGAWAVLDERPPKTFWACLALAMFGAALMLGASAGADAANLWGDAAAVATALCFSAYVLALRAGRRGQDGAELSARLFGPGETAYHATVATTIGLGLFLAAALALGLEDRFWPASLGGWAAVLGLGLFCQALGQGAIVASLGRLPAGFAALVILVEPVTAVLLGWLWLSEAPVALQLAGAACALAAILLARRAAPAPASGLASDPNDQTEEAAK